jgi:hypothetical protein
MFTKTTLLGAFNIHAQEYILVFIIPVIVSSNAHKDSSKIMETKYVQILVQTNFIFLHFPSPVLRIATKIPINNFITIQQKDANLFVLLGCRVT